MSQYNLDLISHELGRETIYQRSIDGYVNATAMCQAADKKFNDYRRLQNTKEFISELSSVAGIPATDLIEVVQGGNPSLQGTWVHPDVAIHLAQWCSPIFAVQVTKFVREWLQGTNTQQKQLQSWKHFHDRIDLTKNSVPAGYFGMFNEIGGMIVPMINSGVDLNEHTIPDISVGLTWAAYWKANNLEQQHGQRINYPHEYPVYYPQHAAGIKNAWCYPNTALAIFREWFRETYQKQKLPVYLTKKENAGHIDASTTNKLIDAFSPKKIK